MAQDKQGPEYFEEKEMLDAEQDRRRAALDSQPDSVKMRWLELERQLEMSKRTESILRQELAAVRQQAFFQAKHSGETQERLQRLCEDDARLLVELAGMMLDPGPGPVASVAQPTGQLGFAPLGMPGGERPGSNTGARIEDLGPRPEQQLSVMPEPAEAARGSGPQSVARLPPVF